VRGLGPNGRRALGHWPSEGEELIHLLIAAVEEAEATASEDDRGKLRNLLDSLRDVATGTASEVLAAVLLRLAGLQPGLSPEALTGAGPRHRAAT
jgi:hypothetical protein